MKIPKDKKVNVLCGYCKQKHSILVKNWMTCPKSIRTGSATGWYILVWSNGKVTQTSHFENISGIVGQWSEEKAAEALK